MLVQSELQANCWNQSTLPRIVKSMSSYCWQFHWCWCCCLRLEWCQLEDHHTCITMACPINCRWCRMPSICTRPVHLLFRVLTTSQLAASRGQTLRPNYQLALHRLSLTTTRWDNFDLMSVFINMPVICRYKEGKGTAMIIDSREPIWLLRRELKSNISQNLVAPAITLHQARS